MKILGVSGGFHDATACLLIDGRVSALVEEERFTRKKHAFEAWPTQAARWCLAQAGLAPSEIDAVAYFHDLDRILNENPDLEAYREAFAAHPEKERAFRSFFGGKKEELHGWCEEMDLPPAVAVEHHDCHIASAYYGSTFEEANILSIDARGETVSTVVAHGKGDRIEKLFEVQLPHSVGLLYTNVTGHLGYRMFDGEGTVMGLAPYGDPERYREDFERIIQREGESFVCRPEFTMNDFIDGFTHTPNGMIQRFGPARPYRHDPRNGMDEDIAASLQEATARIMVHLAESAYKRTGCANLCLAGGVALNAKANGELWRRPFVENLYVQPLANDAGCALGGAMALHHRNGGGRPAPFDRIDWGPEYEEAEILEAIREVGLQPTRPESLAKTVAESLARGQIWGWFQGRMEAGPRALGGRSILADPRRREMSDRVNEKVKFREPWRPFAASILDEAMDDFFDDPSEAPFMIICHPVKPEARSKIAAAVHVDGTTRPQRVRAQRQPLYHELIKRFGEITGAPALLNTSFNLKGQPIVNTPAEAIEMFAKTQMDRLAIGPFALAKG